MASTFLSSRTKSRTHWFHINPMKFPSLSWGNHKSLQKPFRSHLSPPVVWRYIEQIPQLFQSSTKQHGRLPGPHRGQEGLTIPWVKGTMISTLSAGGENQVVSNFITTLRLISVFFLSKKHCDWAVFQGSGKRVEKWKKVHTSWRKVESEEICVSLKFRRLWRQMGTIFEDVEVLFFPKHDVAISGFPWLSLPWPEFS